MPRRPPSFYLVAVLCVAGFLLKGEPADPDRDFSNWRILGCFLLFCGWALSVLSWGNLLARLLRWKQGLFEAFLLGTLWAFAVAFLLTHVGWIGDQYRFPMLALALAGTLPELVRKRPDAPNFISGETSPLVWVTATLVLIRVLRASLVFGHSDPFIYHLLSPRLWWQNGGFYFPTVSPDVMVASYWDYLQIWGNALLSGPADTGLIEGQLFGQWLHSFFGFGGTALALRELLKGVVKETAWLELAVVAGLSSQSLKEYSLVAKNDWGAVFWSVSACALAFGPMGRDARGALRSGWMFGVATMSKFPTIFFLFPAALAWTFKREAPVPLARRLALFLAAFAAACFPLLMRNWLYTSDPFFPFLYRVFPTPWLSPSATGTSESGQIAVSAGQLLVGDKLSLLLRESPLNAAWLLLPLALWLGRAWVRPWIVLAIGWAGSAALFLLIPVSGSLHIRWLNAALVAAGSAGMLIVAALVEGGLARFPRLPSVLRQACQVVFLIVLIRANVVWTDWGTLIQGESPAIRIRRSVEGFVGGDAKAWLRIHARTGSLVVSTADNQDYYISNLRLDNLFTDAELDRATSGLSPRFVFAILRERGGDYLLDTLHWNTYRLGRLVYWGHHSWELSSFLMANAEAVAYWGDLSIVVDLRRLEEVLSLQCVPPRQVPVYL